MVTLQRESEDPTGRVFYEPLVLQVAQASQYNKANPPEKHSWRFHGLEGYWTCNRLPLVAGESYKVQLATKDHGGAQPYRDVMHVRLAEPTEIDTPLQVVGGAVRGSQGSVRPLRPDGEEIFRTKEELRWTEAYHMAVQMASRECEGRTSLIRDWADWFYNELANVGTPPEEPERTPEEDDGTVF